MDLPLLPRTGPLIVLSEVRPGHATPPNDHTSERSYTEGEEVEVRLDFPEPLRWPSLHAVIVKVTDAVLLARATQSAMTRDSRIVVLTGDEFEVERRCVFSVTKTRTANRK
jgi:hypothetical protein